MNELFDAAVTVPPKRRTLQASIPFIVWVCLDLLNGMSWAGWKSRGRAAIYPAASVDAVAHVLTGETVIVPDVADNRNVDVRKNIGWGREQSLASP
jgi:hypothetical protein